MLITFQPAKSLKTQYLQDVINIINRVINKNGIINNIQIV